MADVLYFGYLPMLMGAIPNRPKVIGCSFFPLFLSSTEVSGVSGPLTTPEAREKNVEETRAFQEALQPAQDYINKLIRDLGGRDLPGFVTDCMYTLPDLTLQCTPEEFEFPRRDKPVNLRFVGSIPPAPAKNFQPPSWWVELDGSKPVVMVTQGTIANDDFTALIQPTIDALAGDDVIVVAVAARPEVEEIRAARNARIAGYLPFDMLLPLADVFVTNAGCGGVLQALSMGVPMLLAGTTEEKPQVAARVAWNGCGINLQTSRPKLDQIRAAVRTILSDKQYRANADKFQKLSARYNPLREIAKIVDSIVPEHALAGDRDAPNRALRA
jgi:UDP:flavonoid glycosyltransferase YjiC (YdhE family)